jgi:hypothetical protein
MIVNQPNMLLYPIKLRACATAFALCWLAAVAPAQTDLPLPDVPTLMNQVQDHQRQMEAVRENYTFHELDVTDTLNKNGTVKKTESEDYEVFYVNTHEVQRLVQKDGRDLDADQAKREQEHVMKEVAKAQQTLPGTSPSGEVSISVSHILSMVKVSSPRREMLDGRPTISFDFTGDPHAKAHGVAEEAARKMSGTVWIDEKDREVRRMVARLDDNLHVGFGMFSLSKGSNLVFDQKLVNNELWLPTGAEIDLNAHAFAVVGVRANIHMTDRDYKKFHAEAQQQPGTTVAPSAPQ